MVISTKKKVSDFDNLALPEITIDNNLIEREKNLKNLGVIFDENLTWIKHINKSVCKAYGSLRSLYRF